MTEKPWDKRTQERIYKRGTKCDGVLTEMRDGSWQWRYWRREKRESFPTEREARKFVRELKQQKEGW